MPYYHQLKSVTNKEDGIGSRRLNEGTATVPSQERAIMCANEIPRLMAIDRVALPAPRWIR
jgi:hypothetical protein